ncbi:MAG: aspartyl/glutamyl-tRNA amidotransferase subunit C [Candidatus Pacebacteria bacterium]|nr:aspartyl/glutamyl-tRNA amidotransferase subunit C [Candidatus Paceibacterota bacterium]
MATTEEVQKLAALARIRISGSDLEKFTREFDAILAYVGQLEKLDVKVGTDAERPALRNVMRADGSSRSKSDFERDEPHAAGAYTEKLAAQFPSREGDALVVKQIITHD